MLTHWYSNWHSNWCSHVNSKQGLHPYSHQHLIFLSQPILLQVRISLWIPFESPWRLGHWAIFPVSTGYLWVSSLKSCLLIAFLNWISWVLLSFLNSFCIPYILHLSEAQLSRWGSWAQGCVGWPGWSYYWGKRGSILGFLVSLITQKNSKEGYFISIKKENARTGNREAVNLCSWPQDSCIWCLS